MPQNTTITQRLMQEFSLQEWQVTNVMNLIDEGSTIPFIARYRKEMTGALNDEVLRSFHERLHYLRNLDTKKEQVIEAIHQQGQLTDELREKISQAATLVEVEDLYRPFRPKRRTRALIAKERGLQPLAQLLLSPQSTAPLDELAAPFIDETKEITTADQALAGASDIIAEQIADQAEYRLYIRRLTGKKGRLLTKAKKPDESSVYEMYYDFAEAVSKLAGHQVLAINRGEAEKMLTVSLEAPTLEILSYLENQVIPSDRYREFLQATVQDAYKRLIAPSIENEIRADLTERAEEGAIKVFGKNLAQLLMQPPITGKTVLGFDPAFRTGCKLAVLDPTGKVLDTAVIYPTSGAAKVPQAKQKLKWLLSTYAIEIIAIGNGTASRESEQFVAQVLSEYNQTASVKASYVIVNEAGASVYSASKLGSEEFPEFDVSLRSAASIGRRLQDPLAELVKIDPQSIGVGQYQHDMDQKKLSEALQGVVEDCVNRVGVDVNTASPSLLSYISGISKTIAKNIVAYREQNGSFTSRRDLLKVSKLGPKAFEQCAGFLRIRDGKEPLDNTAVHPESYEAAKTMLTLMGYDIAQLSASGALRAGMPRILVQLKGMDQEQLAEKLGIGVPTLVDIATELGRPGRDPRSDMPPVVLRTDVLSMEDLKVGMVLCGTVRNVIDFGAFVDIGVHQDGLVHISQLSNRFVKHPLDVVKVGDIVDVKVISLDIAKKRIGLSMRL